MMVRYAYAVLLTNRVVASDTFKLHIGSARLRKVKIENCHPKFAIVFEAFYSWCTIFNGPPLLAVSGTSRTWECRRTAISVFKGKSAAE